MANYDMSKISFNLKVSHSTEQEDLLCYGFDASGLEEKPCLVAWPENAEEVISVMRYAYGKEIPVTPRGAGTGMTGGAIPIKGGIVLSFERMARTLDIDSENLNVVVDPGVINGRLQRELEKKGFLYPPDPASMNFCTIGGNVAENAGGPRALKYGVTRDYVMALEAALPDGSLIATGAKTRKSVVGYDLTRLLVGSEGTLAVITKIRLRCLPLPEGLVTMLVFFKDLVASGRAVSNITSARIIPRTLEFMDREAIAAVEKFRPSGLPLDVEAMLLLELDGHPSAIKEEAGKVADICMRLGADVKTAKTEEERQSLWDARRSVSPALYHVSPSKLGEDIVVPRSKIPEMLGSLRRLSEKAGIKIVNFGHAGDGNIHVNIMADRQNKDEYEKANRLIKEIFSSVLSMGGTISGEHGIGLTKKDYISMEIREKEMALMRGIKGVFDPKGVLNPGKIFR